jgi:hypothetical protein
MGIVGKDWLKILIDLKLIVKDTPGIVGGIFLIESLVIPHTLSIIFKI